MIRKLLVSALRATFRFHDTTPIGIRVLSFVSKGRKFDDALFRSDAQPLW